YVIERSKSGKSVQRGRPSRTGTTDWSVWSVSFTSGPDAADASFKIEQYRGSGSAWLDDFRLASPFGSPAVRLGGQVTEDGGGLTFEGDAAGLRLKARFTNAGPAIRVDTSLSDQTGKDRAVELSFALPLDLTGGRFEESFVSSKPVEPNVRYEVLDESFGSHTHSAYPFAAVRTDTASMSLAAPMGPAMQRFSYDTRSGFAVVWDLGLSAAASKTRSRADRTFWIYSQNPRWGLRSAAEKFYALDAESFRTPFEPRGAWITIGGGKTISQIREPGDFGFGYNEASSDLAWDNRHGVMTLRYVDASGWFRSFPKQPNPPSDEELVTALLRDAASATTENNGAPTREWAQAVIQCSPYDESGRYQLRANGYFWYANRLQIYPVSADPDIPAPSMWSVVKKAWIDRPLAKAAASGERLDGFFLDDMSDPFAAVENHRRSLWVYSDLPLSFSYRSGKVVLYDGSSMFEFSQGLSRFAREKRLLLFGSPNPGATVWFAKYLDAFGGEVRGAETPDRAYLRRTLSYGKGFSNLLVSGSGSGSGGQATVEAYLRQGLLLGYFPGFDGRYWGDSSAVERDRPMFRKYVPLIREAVKAGWRPVNYATASRPDVFLERFDDEKSERFFISAQNNGQTSGPIRIAIEGAPLGLSPSRPILVQERVDGRRIDSAWEGAQLLVTIDLAPGQTALLEIRSPGRTELAPAPRLSQGP
ncbi:MAG TPA: hypothetical protein VIA45_13225, partial [Thermoanaerobaculia bacterium]